MDDDIKAALFGSGVDDNGEPFEELDDDFVCQVSTTYSAAENMCFKF